MNFTILVVDDDDDDLLLFANRIKQCHEHITLTHVLNGMEAVQKLTEGLQPSLIMTDANMPIMNGYELLTWVMNSDEWRHVPVVIWTGDISDAEVTRFYQAGANSLMLKQNALQDIESFCHHWFNLVKLPLPALGALS